ncbi:hypothetical protein Slash_1 [Bacillus phage Slash]|uniref:Uncharacterized protein n=2 Tax=Slashvirus TaxID=1921709 RepID=U5PWB0_9CAUD|nr:hypothetical protein Staley_1 [Bacillus phage Staley]YP_008771903.1 hypothetical protein Slash_1 [Bacillus phage Slash]AGY48290.1 hypothetical protein Slash_1 [Bacillus phage Slash]AGY48684.1 hypothetical protein Staley_1 [Bacillus phage Staley]
MFGMWTPSWKFVILLFFVMLPVLPFFVIKWISELLLKCSEWIINSYGNLISKILDKL